MKRARDFRIGLRQGCGGWGGGVTAFWLLLTLSCGAIAQERGQGQAQRGQGMLRMPAARESYSSNLVVIREAQQQALEQARGMLQQIESERERTSLQSAIREMERSQAALEAAADSPEKLAAAIAAQQNAYQALLKVTPKEYRVTRGQRNQNQGGGQSGQPQRQQMEQLEMSREENRYETERQARSEPNAQQRQQLQTADKLKELAQRQQDLNERLRELQTALQAARTATERDEIQRQLKRLQDEQRQMLADVDQLRQEMEQSSNATPESREQLEQTRSDMQRAAQEMENQSASGALAAGSRAQQNMQNLRDELRRQTSSQFTEQMRDMRSDARELAQRQEEIARTLDTLENGPRQSLDNSRERQELLEQMRLQQSAFTNLLSEMRAVTEQSESTEPLLSRQLYDTLRRADQAQTENLMEMGAQLTDRGFLPQAGEAERAVRRNIEDIRQSVERAAESVLGNEADSLRFAERELEELTRQVERELAGGGTGTNAASANDAQPGRSGRGAGNGITNQLALARGETGERGAGGQRQPGNQPGDPANGSGEPGGEASEREGRANGEQPGGANTAEGSNGSQQQLAENARQGQDQNQGQGQGQGQRSGDQRGPGSEQQGQQQPGEGREGSEGSDGQQQTGLAQGRGERPGGGGNENRSGEQNGDTLRSGGTRSDGGGNQGTDDGGYRLRQIVERIGRDGSFDGGPITGGGFVDWSDRLRDVERVLDQADLRNELASARERLAALRAEYREYGRTPGSEVLKQDVVAPLTQVRVWVRQELARHENPQGLVPLDRDPVPENFAELVRRYYEKLGSAQ